MPSVTREIHIEAPPDVVRRHLTDPDRRERWLGPDAEPAAPPLVEPDGTVTWRNDDGDVHIAVVPDGDGSRVTVTEEVELPVTDELSARRLATGDVRRPTTLLAA